MSWNHPQILWLLLLVAALAALRWWWGAAVARRQAGAGVAVAHLSATVSTGRERLRSWMMWGGLALAVVALAGPCRGGATEGRRVTGADLLLALDCSRSMLANDLSPTRMEVARRKVADLLHRSPELRIALMPFAAVPVLRCPLTGDEETLTAMLADCSPNDFPADDGLQGTAIGATVQEGLKILDRQADRGQAILVVSDGADDDKDAVTAAAKAARAAGVPVYGLFLGDSERAATLEIDGKVETMTSDRSTLDGLAKDTGGVCVNATTGPADIDTLAKRLDSDLPQRPWVAHEGMVLSQRYPWLLVPALVLVLIGALLPTRRRRVVVASAEALVVKGAVVGGKSPAVPAPPTMARRAAMMVLTVIGVAAVVAGMSGQVIAADASASAPVPAQAATAAVAAAPAPPSAAAWERLSAAAALPPDQARPAIEAVLVENPDFLAAHYDLGTLKIDGDPSGAAKHFERATASPDPSLAADAWYNLALARWHEGRLDDALNAAGMAAKLDPSAAPFRDQVRKAWLVRADAARRAAEEAARKLHIAMRALPDATVGVAYRAQLVAAGAHTTGAIWTLGKDSSLPPGLALDPDGTVSGVATSPGSRKLALTVTVPKGVMTLGTSATDAVATGEVALAVLPPPVITTGELPEAVSNQPYQAKVAVSGLGNAWWSATGLPAGLAIAEGPGGETTISGTPTASGHFTVAVSASAVRGAGDASQPPPRQAARSFDLEVGDAFAPDRAELDPATAYAQYRCRIGVRGPAQEYRWELGANAPAGFTISAAGELSGMPEEGAPTDAAPASSTAPFVFTPADGAQGPAPAAQPSATAPAVVTRLPIPVVIHGADGRTRSARVILPVNPPPLINEGQPIQIGAGQAVQRPLRITGGTPPMKWSLVDGSLPKGVRLDPDGSLRGATKDAGTFTATISASDHWQAATRQAVTITVAKAPETPPKSQDDKDGKGDGDQAKQDGDGSQAGDKDGKPDQSKQDQGKQDKQDKQDQAKQDQGKGGDKSGDKQDGKSKADADKQAGEKAQAEAAADAAKNGQAIDQAAARARLEDLPPEDHGALRGQLLGPVGPRGQKGHPW